MSLPQVWYTALHWCSGWAVAWKNEIWRSILGLGRVGLIAFLRCEEFSFGNLWHSFLGNGEARRRSRSRRYRCRCYRIKMILMRSRWLLLSSRQRGVIGIIWELVSHSIYSNSNSWSAQTRFETYVPVTIFPLLPSPVGLIWNSGEREEMALRLNKWDRIPKVFLKSVNLWPSVFP